MSHQPLVNNFEVPSWAGKPPPGLHLDVLKDGKMIQKLMIDEKKCYFFGRNKIMCDFMIDHASCSRVHAVLIWHKHLSRPFIIDLGSTHGTHIGHINLESRKPQQVPLDSEIHFGASTRIYIIRERPQPLGGPMDEDSQKKGEELQGNMFNLPESESELDNLTEFNTAHNRRVASLVELNDVTPPNSLKRKRRASHVSFNEEEEVINPEDIDPSIGRFRNLVQTTVIPTKRPKIEHGLPMSSMTDNITKRLQSFSYAQGLYGELPSVGGVNSAPISSQMIVTKLGLPVPNLAPNLEDESMIDSMNPKLPVMFAKEDAQREPKKKIYAKEAWPGKKPTPSLLV